jgi:hypothetical protein
VWAWIYITLIYEIGKCLSCKLSKHIISKPYGSIQWRSTTIHVKHEVYTKHKITCKFLRNLQSFALKKEIVSFEYTPWIQPKRQSKKANVNPMIFETPVVNSLQQHLEGLLKSVFVIYSALPSLGLNKFSQKAKGNHFTISRHEWILVD